MLTKVGCGLATALFAMCFVAQDCPNGLCPLPQAQVGHRRVLVGRVVQRGTVAAPVAAGCGGYSEVVVQSSSDCGGGYSYSAGHRRWFPGKYAMRGAVRVARVPVRAARFAVRGTARVAVGTGRVLFGRRRGCGG